MDQLLKVELSAKMEQYQEQQQQKMEQYQKEQQQTIDELQKTVAMLNGTIGKGTLVTLQTPQNRWDSAACHDKLTLSDPDRSIAQFIGENWGNRSVLAERPIPKGIPAFFTMKDGSKTFLDLMPPSKESLRLAVGCGIEANFGPNFKFKIAFAF
ncbi:hypothetical protein GPALN_004898 [Globodera pallida]|nr:hypothetical protein GPALN_004898 [Globodera pallida]